MMQRTHRLKDMLNSNRWIKLSEIVLIFMTALGFLWIMLPLAGNDPVFGQAIIWMANVIILLLIWLGIRIRGEKLTHLGITFSRPRRKEILQTFLLSILVLVVSVIAFILGSVIMANITGIPEAADMSKYDYLKDNLPMLILTLIGVYIVSSFGEEVIYRAFLITRINELGKQTALWRIISVILSAIVFGLAHYEWGPMGIVQTFFMGLSLGYFYVRLKRRIWILVLAHAYMDTILMVQMYLASQ